ncbi:chymotrypsin-2-like [Cimex lectularius]|uniref:Peptidase S1 domain-containing protein n=1 Tax=Cimex lectularius TaxID=79782 RepID=A0A8I6RDP1_CIMLE|nr:chymotrypsin-2-like [Cimex lectularius]
MLLILILLCWKYADGSIPVVPGRRSAEANEYPYVVSIIDRREIHRCGGSLVHQSCVLTAAVCIGGYSFYAKTFYTLDESDFKIVAGSKSMGTFTSGMGQRLIFVQKLILHPGLEMYKAGHWKNNVGLAITEKPVRFARHIHIPEPFQRYTDVELLTMGWGRSTITWNPVEKKFDYSGQSEELQVFKSSMLDVNTCREWLCTIYAMDNCEKTDTNEFCGVTSVGNTTGVCSGDIGMPVVFNDTLWGVVSWGMPCTSSLKSKFAISDLRLVHDLKTLYPFTKSSSLLPTHAYFLFALLTAVISYF